MKLYGDNRLIQLASHIPWDECSKMYSLHFSQCGRTAFDPRILIGSLIIMHKMGLSDGETVQIIGENHYMKFLPSLDELSPAHISSTTLFMVCRRRLGNDISNELAHVLATLRHDDEKAAGSAKGASTKGKPKLGPTVADRNITYPTDLGPLNKVRERTPCTIKS